MLCDRVVNEGYIPSMLVGMAEIDALPTAALPFLSRFGMVLKGLV
jgi:hypothetical protein